MVEPDIPYIRVGTQYFKRVLKPLNSGDFIEIFIPWSHSCLKTDLTAKEISRILKYDGWTVIANNINYQQTVGTFYNKYLPINYIPKPGGCEKITSFLKHIFGEHFELGLDYFKILYEYPTQRLPVLCLVSKERNTGKTTFLLLIKEIFGGNATLNTNDDFRSNFNSEWAEKLIIGVDETFLDKKEDSERIKNLSTAKYYKQEAKGKDRYEIEFIGKFILCSNNEDSFIWIDNQEVRYWVRKIPVLSKDNKDLLDEMKKEIPAFLDFLLKREFHTKNESRMWFRSSLLETDALRKLKRNNKGKTEQEIIAVIDSIFQQNDINELKFCLNDVNVWIRSQGVRRPEVKFIKDVLQNSWGLTPCKNSLMYDKYWFDHIGRTMKETAKGRYYTITKDDFLKFSD